DRIFWDSTGQLLFATNPRVISCWALNSSNMTPPLEKAALVVLAIACCVTTGWSQTPTPGCTNNTWTATSTVNAPSERDSHTAVWTGSEMIIWGGSGLSGDFN